MIGKVGIQGNSWPGLMGFLTATTQPPSLKAISIGGLTEDFYRGMCYVECNGRNELTRPHHPHTALQPVSDVNAIR